MSLELEEGLGADAIRRDISLFEICYYGGIPPIKCYSLSESTELPLLEMDQPFNGIAEISVWIQMISKSKSSQYEVIQINRLNNSEINNVVNKYDHEIFSIKDDSIKSQTSGKGEEIFSNVIVGKVYHVFIWEDNNQAAMRLRDLLTMYESSNQEETSKTKQRDITISKETTISVKGDIITNSCSICDVIKLHMNYLLCDRKLYIKSGYGVYTLIVGFGTYGLKDKATIHYWGSKDLTLKVGKFCSIGARTEFFLDGNHRYVDIRESEAGGGNSIHIYIIFLFIYIFFLQKAYTYILYF